MRALWAISWTSWFICIPDTIIINPVLNLCSNHVRATRAPHFRLSITHQSQCMQLSSLSDPMIHCALPVMWPCHNTSLVGCEPCSNLKRTSSVPQTVSRKLLSAYASGPSVQCHRGVSMTQLTTSSEPSSVCLWTPLCSSNYVHDTSLGVSAWPLVWPAIAILRTLFGMYRTLCSLDLVHDKSHMTLLQI